MGEEMEGGAPAADPGATQAADHLVVLVANDPPLYRELVARAIQRLRPEVVVRTGDPAELDGDVARLAPHLVIYSGDEAHAWPPTIHWVLLYPAGTGEVTIAVDGQRTTITGFELENLLALIDGLLGPVATAADQGEAVARPEDPATS